jgi:alpha-L-arabinofuranosidase
VGILELNAGAFDFGRGLAHALEINAAHRSGDVIRATAMPNVSQPWKVYQTDWKAVLWTQGNIYYTQDKVWFQTAYFVDQMIAQSWASDVVQADVTSPHKTLDVLAAKTADGKGLVLRVVNPENQAIPARLDLAGFRPQAREAVVQTLAHDDLTDFNTLEQPDKIRPVQSAWRHEGEPRTYNFPAHSFTLIYFK